jgi:RNA polymerase primary sigma factor
MSSEELAVLVQQGQDRQKHLEELWEKNIGLVRTTVGVYRGLADNEDLMQEGFLALCKAAENYDTAAGVAFSTFAVTVIKRAVSRYIDRCKPVKVPARQQEQAGKLQRLENAYRVRCNRKPTAEEVRYHLDLDRRGLEAVQMATVAGNVKSLDVPLDSDSDTTLADTIESPYNRFEDVMQGIDRERMKTELWEAVDSLEGQETEVIKARYKAGLTVKEAGDRLGLGAGQVRQLEYRGLKTLRKPHICKRYKPYYEEYIAEAYKHIGLKSFMERHTSIEEQAILWMEEQGRL